MPRPAALITHTRSGGSSLATCLSNHPDIFCPRGEPLLEGTEWREAFPDATSVDILECITRAHFYKVGLCKITYVHPLVAGWLSRPLPLDRPAAAADDRRIGQAGRAGTPCDLCRRDRRRRVREGDTSWWAILARTRRLTATAR